MESRPRTIAQRKRIVRRKKKLKAGSLPSLGIPPRGNGFMGKIKIGW